MSSNNILATRIKSSAGLTNGTLFANIAASTYDFKVRRIVLGVGTNSGVSLVSSPVIVGLVYSSDPGTATSSSGLAKLDQKHAAINTNTWVDYAWSTAPTWAASNTFMDVPLSTDKPGKVSWNHYEMWVRQNIVSTPAGLALFNDGPDLPSGHYLVAPFEIEV